MLDCAVIFSPVSPTTTGIADCTDGDLISLYREGRVEALNVLLERYRRFARAKARGYFLAGGDYEDIEQEGMIGLYKAARDFRADRQLSFRAFAEMCITRQIITAIKMATRHKHRPLNHYVSLWGLGVADDPNERVIEEMLDGHHVADPAEQVVMAERLDDIESSLARVLSDLEVEVLRLYLEGWSYQEISYQLERHVKSVDNALQRIKRKLEAHLQARQAEDILDREITPAVA